MVVAQGSIPRPPYTEGQPRIAVPALVVRSLDQYGALQSEVSEEEAPQGVRSWPRTTTIDELLRRSAHPLANQADHPRHPLPTNSPTSTLPTTLSA